MLRQKKQGRPQKQTFLSQGQTIVEYSMLLGVMTAIIFAMGTHFRRGVYTVIKLTTDQLGCQINGDQPFDDRGHLNRKSINRSVSSITTTLEQTDRKVYMYNDIVSSIENSQSNLGFTNTE